MRLLSAKLNSLDDLFVMQLKDIYSAENQITQALPKMIEEASSQELKDKFKDHLAETRDKISGLGKIFDMLDIEPEEEYSDGMAGIIKEVETIARARGNPKAKDAGLVAAAQKAKHYQISTYKTLNTFAKILGYGDVADKLQTTLSEESHNDEMLSQFAENSIYPPAV